VLGDLSVAEFTRLMTAITSWVAPEQGCNYCHIPSDLASDDVYTKVVARRMLQMTEYVNADHATHVGQTGVTCYTCHRGANVPAQTWTDDPEPPRVAGMAGWRDGQNVAGVAATAYSALPFEPFQRYLTSTGDAHDGIRVASLTALPQSEGGDTSNIKDTEHTYALMMHISDSLGVNCTYCHNSRAFSSWEQSNPARTTAWYGLTMVADINEQFLTPLAGTLPDNRLGPSGDAPKANCGTCHQGLPKPLNGAPMLSDYPSLAGPQ
jgi:photosynthetic reaction center cytochrome c subunit